MERTKTAVITGHHPYDVVALQDLFRSLPGIDAYPQNLEDFVTDTGGSRESYGAVVFYNFHVPTPGPEEYPLGGGRARDVLEALGKTEQGIVLLHHAILAYPRWELWQELCGGVQIDSSLPVLQNQTVPVKNVAPEHPITSGLGSWEIVDETYAASDPGDGSEALLTTDHPQSMTTLAWTRRYKRARVFCYQSGHDDVAFENEGFRTVLSRGIWWAAGRL